MPGRFKLAAFIGVSAALIAACTGPKATTNTAGGGPSQGGSGGSLNIYLYQEPAGLFGPLAPSNGPNNQVMSLIDQSLLAVDPQYKLQPQLATSYDVSPDAKTFTFHLRTGLKWSDGTPFTAQDVVYSYDLLADPKSTSATAGNYSGVQGVSDFIAGKAKTISGFSAPDDHTFVVKSTQPNAGLVAQIATAYIMPKHILDKVPVAQVANNSFFRKPSVSLGPYKFVDYKPNQYVHVTANPDYQSKVSIKDIYLKPMTSDVATGQLGNGGIDIASFSAADLPTVQGLKNVSVQQAPGAGFVRIALNQTKSYFKDPRVRRWCRTPTSITRTRPPI
jgi:ABC-type transport system substrate-binding protein